jgi:hypothetical protein
MTRTAPLHQPTAINASVGRQNCESTYNVNAQRPSNYGGGWGWGVPRAQQDHVPSTEDQPEPDTVRHHADVVSRKRLIEENRQRDLDGAADHRETPRAKAHHFRRDDLQQAVGEKERAEDHRQNEIAVLVADQNQRRRGGERDALHVA